MLKDFSKFVKDKGNEFLSEGVMIKFTLEEFANIFRPQLLESEGNDMLIENAYSFYEMGVLYEQNKSWFSDDSPIYTITGDLGTVLFKNESMFIINERTMRAINEGLFGELSDGWERVKANAKKAYTETKNLAKGTWDLISTGAKKAISFSSKIIAATTAFVTENPIKAVVIGLQVLSIGTAFLPPPFNLISPFLLAISGGIEIYQGIEQVKKGWEKVSELDLSRGEKIKESLMEGLPDIIAGSVATVLGLHDIMEAPAALAGSGIGTLAAKRAAHAWETRFLGKFSEKYNNMVSVIIKDKGTIKLAQTFGKDISKILLKAGNSLMSLLVTLIMNHCGKEILGGLYDVVLSGANKFGEFIKFLIDAPKNISSKLNSFIDSANKTDSPMVKIVASALSTFVAPFIKIVSSVIDSTLRPLLEPVSQFMSTMGKNKTELEKLGRSLDDSKEPPVFKKEAPRQPKKYETGKEDLKYIKKIGVIQNNQIVFPGFEPPEQKPWSFKEAGQVKKNKK
jgi:ElaB/YqjD/DUF883 family membrane-anchored ribosome-binding protein